MCAAKPNTAAIIVTSVGRVTTRQRETAGFSAFLPPYELRAAQNPDPVLSIASLTQISPRD